MRRAASLAVLVLALLPAAASAGPVLSGEDAAELANTLVDAHEEHGVCYGWFVTVDDDSGGPSGDDTGSHLGPGRPVDAKTCPQYVVLTAYISYTSDSSESEDSANVEVQQTLPGSLTNDLKELGYDEDDLLGDENDVALMNMVGALPALAAERAGLKPIAFEPPDAPVEQQGKPTDSPGSDFVRQNLALLILGFVLLGLGVVWVVLDIRGLLRPGLRAAKRAMD